ncbi:MAG: hypothetical protein CBC38_03545 [Gammaproteobacteria bacterium TMED78]|nr:MAG: hypothetical protein CBC38_03545 [Gammaproteobacteria bacterium TMED78]|tara:strand:- start:5134 stop:5784 length:651 start_codon:yes stop_codon:yes gene_type:complete
MILEVPILYSFRRCPYAIRARMALSIAGIRCELREVVLSDKPSELIDISPKATVPVLCLSERVIDESLDIIEWTRLKDDYLLLPSEKLNTQTLELISIFDNQFKLNLDRYKYPNLSLNQDPLENREACLDLIKNVDELFLAEPWLYGKNISLLDLAILPFIRQFRNIDTEWFDQLNEIPNIRKCLNYFMQSKEFLSVMGKYDQWQLGNTPVYFPPK